MAPLFTGFRFGFGSGGGDDSLIGTPYEGGFFAGYISHTADGVATHGLIVAPAATGASGSPYVLSTYYQWKTPQATATSGTSSSFDGAANSANMNNANHPAAQFCEGLTIGGYSDWYLPARYELAIAYENLTGNSTSWGINDYAVGAPAQTSVAAFQSGGAEAFVADRHWSSTEASTVSAWTLDFTGGLQENLTKISGAHTRAFRKFAI
jgi:hypothetical protein